MRYLIALLAIAGIVVSSLALRVHFEDPGAAPPCAVDAHFDCGIVNHSRFAVFPPSSFDEDPAHPKTHIPVAAIGIAGYALIAVLALAGRLWWSLQAIEIGFAFAAFLTYLEAYVLQKWCIYCLWSMAIITAALLVNVVTLVLRRRNASFRAADSTVAP